MGCSVDGGSEEDAVGDTNLAGLGEAVAVEVVPRIGKEAQGHVGIVEGGVDGSELAGVSRPRHPQERPAAAVEGIRRGKAGRKVGPPHSLPAPGERQRREEIGEYGIGRYGAGPAVSRLLVDAQPGGCSEPTAEVRIAHVAAQVTSAQSQLEVAGDERVAAVRTRLLREELRSAVPRGRSDADGR